MPSQQGGSMGIGALASLSDEELLPLWRVTLTLAGDDVDEAELKQGLDRLVQERPFMLSVKYSANRTELQYWDEAEDVDDAAALALRLWGDHKTSCQLPSWRVVGIEVIDRDTIQLRGNTGSQKSLIATGVVRL
jgi:hypothetical protein